MKKLFHFIVDKHRLVLIVMIALCMISAVIIPQVGLNTDMTKYLPDDSPMKQGIDLMGEEFPDIKTLQTIRVMFQDLSDTQKAEIQTKLEGIQYVESVAYDAKSADNNKDNYTLFALSTEYGYDSNEEKAINTALEKEFAQYDMVYKNNNYNAADIPTLIIVVALILLIIVLFIMCQSWTEPFLFLATIGIAIVINLGTNIFMGEISNITFSIGAILQLVLSMDYSIILMNRYRQESQKTNNKLDAMKSALCNSFSSIASSGMTTVVGLLMLVFMSFKIGMDLGIVLAKGVTISMISVFTVLPGLILLCDNLIRKTAKKGLTIPMGKVAAFSFRFRHVLTGAFVVIFISTFFLQGMTETTYSRYAVDPIADIFPPDNAIIMLYDNEDEDKILGLTDGLETDSNVKSAISYPTALGKPYTASDLTEVIEDLGSEMDLDPSMLNILYYDYFTDGKTSPMTAGEFLQFVTEDVAQNDAFAQYLGDDIQENLDTMKQFADADALTRPMNASELASFFDMDAENIEQLLLYYYTQNGGADTGEMTLPTFADFVVKEVAAKEEYASQFDAETLAQMETLSSFTDRKKMTQPLSYSEAATLLGMEPEQMKLLFVYYDALSAESQPTNMTVPDFVQFLSTDMAQNPMFSSQFDEATQAQLLMLGQFTDKAVIQKQMTSAELAGTLGMEPAMIEQVFALYYGGENAKNQAMTLPEFTGFLVNSVLTNEAYAGYFDEATKAQLIGMNQMMGAASSGAALTAGQLSAIVGLDEAMIQSLFAYQSNVTGQEVSSMTLPAFLNFVLNDIAKNPAFAPQFDEATLAQLGSVNTLVQAAASGQTFTAAQLAQMMGLDESLIQQIFTLYYGSSTEGKTLSVEQFVNFLLTDVVSNPAFAGYFDEATIQQLNFMQGIMKASLSGKAYSPSELAGLLGMESSMVKLCYAYHDSAVNGVSSKRSIQTVVNFLVSNSSQFGAMLGSEELAQLRMAQKIINGSVAGTKYTAKSLSALVGMEADQLEQLYLLYLSEHGDTSGWKLSVQDFVGFINDDVMKNETFSKEFDADTAKQLESAKVIIDAVISGKKYSPEELSTLMEGMSDELDKNTMELLYLYYASTKESDPNWKLSMDELFGYLSDDIVNDARFEKVLDASFRSDIDEMKVELDDGIAQLKGPNYSILMLNTTFPSESEETSAFIETVMTNSDAQLSGDYYLIGDSPMNYEMENSFDGEMLLITLLTAISIFVVVALTFRSLCIPAILVLIVQCGVYITITASGLLGYSIYFLALLIVQCILMGATIDYGILFTNYYREHRKEMDRPQALAASYSGSIHTILTSGLIMILVTGIIGFSPVDPTIGQICQTISIGALSAILLILFILPGLLSTFDRFVVKKEKKGRK